MRDPAEASSWTDRERTRVPSADPTLVVISSGELHGQTLLERTVGRAAGNDLRLDDPYTSRHYAVLRRAGEPAASPQCWRSIRTVEFLKSVEPLFSDQGRY
jgi:hypothetical protein